MRASDIDYDQIPSPKSYPSVRSSMNGRGPSTLSKSFVAQEPTPEPEFDYANSGAFDEYEPPQPNESPPRSRTPETSPAVAGQEEELAGDEEEAVEVEQAVTTRSNKADKGKRRADPVEEDEQPNPGPYDANGLEDDVAQGFEEFENALDDENNAPPAKKPRKEAAKSKKPRSEKRVTKTPVERAYCVPVYASLTQSISGSPTPEGVRRGRRHRYKPLEWWRQEKVVYGRRDSDLILVPHIKEIVRIPHEPVQPLGKAGKRKRGTGVRGKSKGRDTSFNPEEGWDDNTPTNATVIDYDTQEEVSRRKDCIDPWHD